MNNLGEPSGADIKDSLERAEPVLYLAAFALALALRWINLGASPLGDAEASWAMQALAVARPALAAASSAIATPFQPGPNPGYIFPTGIIFWLFGSTDFLARAWPALVGALVVLAAYLFRRQLGRPVAVILAFGLAVDPGLVTVSRQAGGPMAAAVFSILAVGLWRGRHPVLAGIAGGLAVLGGPSILPGVFCVALALWAASAAGRRLSRRYTHHDDPSGGPTTGWDAPRDHSRVETSKTDGRSAVIAAAITLVLAGTALLRFPQGLQAFFASLTSYLQNWGVPAQVSPMILILALVVYELLPLFFALIHGLRMILQWETMDDEQIIVAVFAGVWALAALVLTLIYPARQTSDLVWVIIPLWVLAASEIGHYLPQERPHVMVYLQAAMVIVLSALFWLTLITTPVVVQTEVPWESLRLVILAGILVLMVLTSALVALGWSWPISRDGSAWGVLAGLLVFTIAMMWGASQLRPNQPNELWGQVPGPGQERLMADTLRQVSVWARGMANQVDVVSNVDTPSLRWMLRNYPRARFSSAIAQSSDEGTMPSVVITSAQEQTPELAASYRGQDFGWWNQPAWSGTLPDNLKDWLTYRRAPQTYDAIILWARTDLFPGASATQ